MVELKNEAAYAGVRDLDAAQVLADADIQRQRNALSPLGRLAHAMLKLQPMNGIIVHKEGFSLLAGGGIYAALLANPEAKAELVREITDLRMKLIAQGVLPLEYAARLPEDSAEYKQGVAEVRADCVGTLRVAVENQVVKRNQILRTLQQAEGSKNAGPNNRALNKVNQTIIKLLEELAPWEVFGTDRAPAWKPTADVIAKVHKGEFPWATQIGGDTADEALQRHFGERYRTATAQVERTKEEIGFLKMEVVRLVNGLEERIEAVTGAIEVDLQVSASAQAAGDARKARVMTGRSELRKMERERLEMIKEEADKLRAQDMFKGK